MDFYIRLKIEKISYLLHLQRKEISTTLIQHILSKTTKVDKSRLSALKISHVLYVEINPVMTSDNIAKIYFAMPLDQFFWSHTCSSLRC